jgi:hypothetical protein
MSISRFFLIAAGLLAFSAVGATAQQNNPSGEGGSAMKSTGPSGQSGAMKSSMSGDSMKSTNNGYEKKQAVSGPAEGNHASTGPSGKQPQ